MYYCVIKITLGIKDGMMEMMAQDEIYYPETRRTVTTATTSTATTRTEET